MTDNKISSEKLAEAKEKLACHIKPPGHADNSGAGASGVISRPQNSFMDEAGRIYMTRMTDAGG